MNAVRDSALRDRATRLFRFLAELSSLRIKKTRDVATYESAFWFKDLPQEREVYTHAWGTLNEQEPWLRIEKPKKPAFEKPPESCRSWYDADEVENFSAEPQLLSERPDHEPRILVDVPEVRRAWDAYLREKWHPWKVAMERWERVQRCYRQLFAIHQEQERRGE